MSKRVRDHERVVASIRSAIEVSPESSWRVSWPAPDAEAGGVMLAGWVEARGFSTTRLRYGYDREEVDAFLTEIRDSFLGLRQPSLTPEEIRGKCFSTTRLRPGRTRRRSTTSSMRPNCGFLLRSCRPARGQARTTRGHARTRTTGASALRSVTCRASWSPAGRRLSLHCASASAVR